ncbi:hypothetical protein NQ314_011800 [Rhamnusium bicolor]|uniref:Uncharacterized protein n=1 Tax=Rhamnusium bicolor TaxID=1586634 RepID=A0AAV8XFK7_9CUCU|nr:hypothetical protein NQ314_011800 [Rhamnusium bicolor]
MGPPCKCKLLCSTKFPDDVRSELFKKYWAMGSLQRQRDYLSSCVEPLQIKYRRIKVDNTREPRRQNCSFSLLNDGKTIRVCKTFIINTLGITERTIRTVIQAKSSGVGIIPEDRRGKHNNQMKMHQEMLDSIRTHINSIPRIESHYLRAKTTREFIDGGLTCRNAQEIMKFNEFPPRNLQLTMMPIHVFLIPNSTLGSLFLRRIDVINAKHTKMPLKMKRQL